MRIYHQSLDVFVSIIVFHQRKDILDGVPTITMIIERSIRLINYILWLSKFYDEMTREIVTMMIVVKW